MCFQKDGKTAQAARCIKSRIMTNAIDYVLLIDKFEQQGVVLTGMLKSPRLKYYEQTIFIDQYLSNNYIASQITTTYSPVRQQENKIIAFQPFQHLIIIHNLLPPHPQVY